MCTVLFVLLYFIVKVSTATLEHLLHRAISLSCLSVPSKALRSPALNKNILTLIQATACCRCFQNADGTGEGGEKVFQVLLAPEKPHGTPPASGGLTHGSRDRGPDKVSLASRKPSPPRFVSKNTKNSIRKDNILPQLRGQLLVLDLI